METKEKKTFYSTLIDRVTSFFRKDTKQIEKDPDLAILEAKPSRFGKLGQWVIDFNNRFKNVFNKKENAIPANNTSSLADKNPVATTDMNKVSRFEKLKQLAMDFNNRLKNVLYEEENKPPTYYTLDGEPVYTLNDKNPVSTTDINKVSRFEKLKELAFDFNNRFEKLLADLKVYAIGIRDGVKNYFSKQDNRIIDMQYKILANQENILKNQQMILKENYDNFERLEHKMDAIYKYLDLRFNTLTNQVNSVVNESNNVTFQNLKFQSSLNPLESTVETGKRVKFSKQVFIDGTQQQIYSKNNKNYQSPFEALDTDSTSSVDKDQTNSSVDKDQTKKIKFNMLSRALNRPKKQEPRIEEKQKNDANNPNTMHPKKQNKLHSFLKF